MKTATQIAIECASKSEHNYTQVEKFQPHDWVIEAMESYHAQFTPANGGDAWIKNSERQPLDSEAKFIKYVGYKDVAYFEHGSWFSMEDDSVLPKAFVNDLEWLDESIFISPVQQVSEETISIIETLMQYGNIHPIDGVIYPQGTHREFLKKASLWLDRSRTDKGEGME